MIRLSGLKTGRRSQSRKALCAYTRHWHATQPEEHNSMDWYKVYQGLPTDPKLAVVAKRTGLSRAETLAL